MVTNYYSLVFADPYTLKAVYSFPFPELQGIFLIEETNYIILTRFYNKLSIFDFMQQKPVLTMDNSKELQKFPDGTNPYQYSSKIYTLKNGQKIILTTNDMGVIYWTINIGADNLEYKYIGYIEQFLYNNYNPPITNLFYTEVLGDQGQLIPTLWAGDVEYIYNISLNESADDSSLKIKQYTYKYVKTWYKWYIIKETSMIYISSEEYVTIFDYQNNFYGDLYCRRYMRQIDGSQDQYILLSGNKLALYDKGNFGTESKSQKNKFDQNVRWTYGSFYKVRNQLDYYFVKVGEDGENSKIYTFPIYPLEESGSTVDITDLYSLEWKNLSQNLDPFYLDDIFWVALGFPYKENTEDYLFILIDCTSQNQNSYFLRSNKTTDSLTQTAFAVASLDNPKNLELIGVDNLGTIYTWDLGQDGFPFKFYINFSICQNSEIGDIFYYNETISRLIISCSNSNVYSIDYVTGKYQKLIQLSQQPVALKAFSNHKLVTIGDFNTGIAYIFKFNPQSSNFDLFLKLQSSKIQDQIVHIEVLNDSTIWVQFTLSNLFYSLNDCLEDPNLCTQCSQEYYFEATEKYDQDGVYGVGSSDYPFTTSNNFLTAMIKITFNNFSLSDCILGDNFSILTQESNLKVLAQNITLANNICSNNDNNPSPDDDDEKISALFSSGNFKVTNMTANNNTFCKKIIFSCVSSLNHINYVFSFKDIKVYDNFFQAKTEYLFFDALYSMRVNPDHELHLDTVLFRNNSLIKKSNSDLIGASYFLTSKIATISAINTQLINHFDLKLGLFQNANNVTIQNFQCINDDDYLIKIPNQQTNGCLQLNEISYTDIKQIKIKNKKAQDTQLLKLQNSNTQQSVFTIQDGEFQNLLLYQNQKNIQAQPIQLESNFDIEITIDKCLFQNNTLQSVQFTLAYSTAALWIQNSIGNILIKNSQFYDSNSNSLYGLIYIQSNQITLDTVQFRNFTFPQLKTSPMFQQNGAMMNAKAEIIKILKSDFSQATAIKGSFLYLTSFGQVFQVSISDSTFNEGYALLDGAAIYIDSGGQQLQFNCHICQFSNLYTLTQLGSTIGQEKYSFSKSKAINQIGFQGGYIKNVFGVTDNYFIDVTNSNLQFSQIPSITSENFNSNTEVYQQYLTKYKSLQQQATLANLQKSYLKIEACKLSNLKIQSFNSVLPLLISSASSNITISNTQIEDSLFTNSAINAQQSNIQFQNVSFNNVSQAAVISRNLQLEIYSNPISSGSSLIISQQSSIDIKQKSSFNTITCKSNCNGGAIQLLQGTLSIDDTVFSKIESSFGGALYIEGINNTNIISNTQFLKCASYNDGGAFYLKALQQDKFDLTIQGSSLVNNTCQSRGGAIFVDSEVMNSPKQTIQILNSKILQNQASVGGGIFQQNISINTQKDNVISSNTGTIQGNDNISYPSKLRINNIDEFLKINQGKQEQNKIIINDFRSGANLTDIQFVFLNDKSEIINPITQEDYDTYKISVAFDPKTANLTKYSVGGSVQANFNPKKQAFDFENITLVGKPGSSAYIQFSSMQIYVADSQQANFIQNYTFNILINFRLCGPGEQIAQLGQVTECQQCSANYYSFYVENCQDCPEGATCNGGTNVVANKGYWRKTNISSLVISCSNLPDNCAGGDYGDNICYEGHIGALCEECDIYGQFWGESYAKSAKFSCTKCSQIKGNIWIVVLMTIWTLISMCLAIKGDVDLLKERAAFMTIQRNLQKKYTNKNLQKMQTPNEKTESFTTITKQKTQNEVKEKKQKIVRTDEEKSGVFIKMLTNYVQIVGSIATFNLSIPSGIFEFPQSVGQPLKQTMNSLDCALQEMDTSMPIIYLRLLFSVLIPFIYMAIFLICMGLYFIYKKISTKKNNSKKEQFPWYILATAVMFLIIYVQPDLVAQIIALLSCREIGDTNYILSNVSFVCYNKEHIFYALVLIIPMLLIWMAILPGILFILLRRNRQNLEQIEVKLKYGFLYKEYQTNAFYWEFIKMAEKLAIILALNFYSQSINTKAILVFVVITSYGLLAMVIQPYLESDVNEVDVNSTHVCALTVLLGLFMYQNKYPYFVYTALALIVIINAWFLFKLLNKIIGGYIPKIKQSLQQLAKTLSEKISFFKKFVKEEEKNKKQIKPEIKQKLLFLSKKFASLDPQKKKKIYIEAYELRLVEEYKHIFEKSEIQQQEDKENPNQQKTEANFFESSKLIAYEKEDQNLRGNKQKENLETLFTLSTHKKQDSDNNLIQQEKNQTNTSRNEDKPKSKFYIESFGETLKEDQINIEMQKDSKDD